MSSPQGYQRSLDSFTIAWAGSGSKGPSDSHSGIKGYQYKIEDGLWQGDSHSGAQNCSDVLSDNVYTLDATYDSLATGESTFYLRTWDNACNVAITTISAILKYNSDAPAAPEDLTVIPETNTANSFSFTWDVPAEFNGSASGLSYCYTINTQPSASTCTWTTDTSLAADAYANQPGENTFYIIAKDEAGNVNYADYATVNFTANTPAPGVPINVDVADISVKATSNWKLVFSWEAPTNVGAGVDYYKIFRTITNTTCTANFSSFDEIGTTSGTSYADTGLIQQTYYYCAKACDSANNCSAVSSTYSGFPDGKYVEAAELTSGPSAGGITTKRAKISWSTDRTCDSKIQYRKSSSDDYYDEEPSNSEHLTDHEINLTSLDPGTRYYYRAKWTDEDGNTGASDEKSFKTDPAPTVSSVKESDIGISSALITFKIKDASKVTVFYGESTSYGGISSITTSTQESSYSIKLEGLKDGTGYHYKLQLEDSEEEQYDFEDHTFETLPRPRISDVKIQQVKGTAQPTVYVTWISNTEISSIITYYPEGNSGDARDEVNVELISGNHSMVIRGLIPQTKYTLIVKGRDKIGNEAESDAHSFTTATDTRPPQISNLTVEGASIPPTKREGEINIQLLVSWDTDEPATSQVEYGEGTGNTYSQKTQEDSNSTFNHMVIISGLTPSKVYHLRAISKDEADNTSKSIDTVTISPKATDSAFDLVISNLQELFGFAVKKQ